MDFALTEEQAAVQATFRDFAEREIRPHARDLDENPRFPREIFDKVGELGFFGMRYPAPEGSGADVVSFTLAVEQLARASLGVAASCTMQALMGSYFVHAFTEGEVRQRVVGPLLRGELVGTICMTEPNAGSDLFSMTTKAVEKDGRYLLSGQKTWITAAPVADLFTVFARTGEKELSVFLVERGAPGLTVGKSIHKMGIRASLTSELSFEETPAVALLGKLGEGSTYLQRVLAEIRVMTAGLALGVGTAAYEEAVRYSAERQQFGRTIDKFQAVAAHLADMAVELEAARRLTYWAAWRSDQGLPNAQEASMAKLFASETANRACDRAARVFASYGYADEYPVGRFLRDARFTLIGGGTSEILRVNIAKGIKP